MRESVYGDYRQNGFSGRAVVNANSRAAMTSEQLYTDTFSNAAPAALICRTRS